MSRSNATHRQLATAGAVSCTGSTWIGPLKGGKNNSFDGSHQQQSKRQKLLGNSSGYFETRGPGYDSSDPWGACP